MPGRDLPDLEERLRQLPTALTVRTPAGLAERIARRGRARRRLRRAGAATVVAALLAGAVLTRAVVLDRAPAPVLNPGLLAQNATPAQLAGGHWQALAPLPAGVLAPRGRAAVVWTGRQLLVWGGVTIRPPSTFRAYDDGAAYDPATRRWTPLPRAPEAHWLEGDQGLAVWTGRELLVWGGVAPDPGGRSNVGVPAQGVAYDPERRSWRRLPPRPAELPRGRDLWTVWTGRELLAGTVQEAGDSGGSAAAAYDPAADQWRMLPPSPGLTRGAGTLDARTAMWAGSRLLVWNFLRATPRALLDETEAADRPETRPDAIDLWAYDPAGGRWSVLPSPPEQVREVSMDAAMAWTGREVVIASARDESAGGRRRIVTRAGRYHPDRAAWAPIDPPPRRAGTGLRRVRLAWTGSVLVEPGNAAYDPATDRWLPLPDEPGVRANPPGASGDAARALLRLRYQATGAIRVWALTPSGQPGP
jgi:hypothetical protein